VERTPGLRSDNGFYRVLVRLVVVVSEGYKKPLIKYRSDPIEGFLRLQKNLSLALFKFTIFARPLNYSWRFSFECNLC